MSQWTHINASIRFDALLGRGVPTEKDLGTICTFENWQETDMPCGSEGSLEYKLIINPNINHMAAAVGVFYGDLRDYNDTQEILNYFIKITKDKMIRSGILEIDVEREALQVYRYDSNNSKWLKILQFNTT